MDSPSYTNNSQLKLPNIYSISNSNTNLINSSIEKISSQFRPDLNKVKEILKK